MLPPECRVDLDRSGLRRRQWQRVGGGRPWVGVGEWESELGMWEEEQRVPWIPESCICGGQRGGQGGLVPQQTDANATPPLRCLQVRVLPAPLPPVPQPVCTYRELSFASIRLPGCPPGVDPMVSFPVALSCRCGPCRLSSSDCGGPRAQSLACDRPALPDLLFL